MEKGAERSTPPPPEHTKQGKTFSIGQARKRAIAVFIVLTNLVPVHQPILSQPLSLICFKDDLFWSRYWRWTHHRTISWCGWTKSSSVDPSIVLVRILSSLQLRYVS